MSFIQQYRDKVQTPQQNQDNFQQESVPFQYQPSEVPQDQPDNQEEEEEEVKVQIKVDLPDFKEKKKQLHLSKLADSLIQKSNLTKSNQGDDHDDDDEERLTRRSVVSYRDIES